ncbi:MAG TPA: GAF domain-containing protein [Bosea sp. (in: a-proteobacteria)]|uniref:GAF domain-containing protein n=1 Tax=Bosea sp. (in: a-proteobacteria) TaxID=1871050 RepID=UPI002E1043C8|nr:GAF domain-containing protein [Bosea sp. (in: a-proteobacteria)]
MTIPPLSVTGEAARFEKLRNLDILDTAPEPAFDGLVSIARTVCNTPTALISLVDKDGQWFKARSGFEPCETNLDSSVCAHALRHGSTLIIPDLSLDLRTAANPLVTDNPGIRFYAGALLKTSDGHAIGTLCVIDTEPRPKGLNAAQVKVLEGLADQAVALIEMRIGSLYREASNALERESAERSQAATEAGRVGIFDIDLATNEITPSAEMCRIFGVEPAPAYDAGVFEKLLIPDDQGKQSNRDDRTAGVSQLMTEYRIKRAHDGALRWIARRGGFITGADGSPLRFTGTVSDITERKLAELRQQVLIDLGEMIREAESVSEIVGEAARMLGENLSVSRVGYAAIDIPADLFDVQSDWCAPGIESLVGHHSLAAFHGTAKFLRTGQPLVVSNIAAAHWLRGDSEGYAVIGTNAKIKIPLMRRAQLIGCFFVHHETARTWTPAEVAFVEAVAERVYAGVARIRAEEEQALLNQELSHRLKNTLAMVAAIAKQTLRGVTEKEAVEAFHARLLALASAHDVLLQNSWSSARIRTVIESGLALHAKSERISAIGPDVKLGPKAALSLSMLLHELATNAIKYGALSVPEGKIEIAWSVERETSEAMLRLIWREIGGPPAISPERKGFGSRLISSGLVGTGKAELSYDSTGLVGTFLAPLSLLTQH